MSQFYSFFTDFSDKLLDKKFAGEYLLIDRPIGILGRNVLNNLCLLFDGIRGKWGEQK
jgi:hypothetical protein